MPAKKVFEVENKCGNLMQAAGYIPLSEYFSNSTISSYEDVPLKFTANDVWPSHIWT